MSRTVNEVILVGHIGNDPEIRSTAGGSRVAKLAIATNRFQGKDKEEKTDWHRLTVLGKLVDVVEQWVKKGDKLYVRGRIEYSQTEGDNGPKYWTDIVVNDLVMLGGGTAAPSSAKGASRAPETDDMPF
jgi:single-strand DNA-binding protein